MPTNTNLHPSDSQAKVSIAGILILTAVVAVHVAAGRWNLGMVVLLAPFSLSILAIETLRRLFKLTLVRAMVVGVLFSGICYASIIGGIPAWNYWFRQYDVDFKGRIVQAQPRVAILADIFLDNLIFPLGWYLIAGAIVMLAYTMISVLHNQRANDIVRSRLQNRDKEPPVKGASDPGHK